MEFLFQRLLFVEEFHYLLTLCTHGKGWGRGEEGRKRGREGKNGKERGGEKENERERAKQIPTGEMHKLMRGVLAIDANAFMAAIADTELAARDVKQQLDQEVLG